MDKLLICGRSCSGKDTYARELEKHGLKGVCSYTTRPRRDGEGDTHIFITEDEVKNYPNKIAITEINGYTYFATKEQLEEADYYIIDPLGIKTLQQNYPDISFKIVYMYAPTELRKQRAVQRGGAKEEQVFEKRNESEDGQFTEFEQNMTSYDLILHRNTKDDPEFIQRCVIYDLYGLLTGEVFQS